MTQFAHNPALIHIEDQLDLVGQKYRGQQIIRGALLWIAAVTASTWVATLTSHFIGDATNGVSGWTWVILILWLGVIGAATIFWFIRPLLIRPGTVEMARLLESKVAGLHNGLTNSVLLARRDDLVASPWLPPIFDEIQANLSAQPIGDAVRMSDLNPIILRCSIIALPLLLTAAAFPSPFLHGWQQLFHPAMFVPKTGTMKITQVTPGDVTLVAGQPLEIDATATGPETPEAKLIFDPASTPAAVLSPAPIDGGIRYTYRLDHVDQSMKYRLEVGSSQSPWYSATVVKQIKLVDLALSLAAPEYTHKPAAAITLKPETIDTTPVTALQGSRVTLAATIDIPANGAMLQLGDKSPVPMTANLQKTGYTAQFTVQDDTPVAVLLTDGAGQIIAKLPEQQFVVHCTKDTAPTIDMKWPTADAVVSPKAELKISATLKDDYGLTGSRILAATSPDAPLTQVARATYPAGTAMVDLATVLDSIPPEIRKHGNSIRVQVEATDNRDLGSTGYQPVGNDIGGPQVSLSPIIEIKFRDPEITAAEEKEQADKLKQILTQMLNDQHALYTAAMAWRPADAPAECGKSASVRPI